MVAATKPPQSAARPKTGPALSISGSKPASRSGAGTAGPRATGSRQGTAARAVDALAATLISKMREKFGDAAKDVLAQETISKEVTNFMAKSGSMQEEDLGALEDTIRTALTGRTPPRNTMAMDRKARLKGDEWARIWKYETERVHREVARDHDIDLEKRARQRRLLDEQVAEKKAAADAERQADLQAGHVVQQDVTAWQEEEAAKRAREHAKVMHFKELQDEQVADKQARVRKARAKRDAEETEMAQRIAYEVRCEFEKEEAARVTAKGALVEFLAGNEVTKRAKEAEKVRQQEEDLDYMRQYEEILDKQQKERLARLEKLKQWQDKGEAKAAAMPESKRWIDPAIIQRNFEANEAARAAEEERRRAVVVEGNQRMLSALNQQVAQRAVCEASKRESDEKFSKAYLATAGAEQERALAERRRRLQLKLQAKLELEAQMRENARRRRQAPMSDIERRLNGPLLAEVDRYEATDAARLKPYPAEYLPRDLKAVQSAMDEHHARARLKSARGLPAARAEA